jgi:hypothetical protein
MRASVKDVISALGIGQRKVPKNSVIDYGVSTTVPASNTVIPFNVPFAQSPVVTFSVYCAWNADPSARIVALSPTQVTIVAASAGSIYWMAIGPEGNSSGAVTGQTLEDKAEGKPAPKDS